MVFGVGHATKGEDPPGTYMQSSETQEVDGSIQWSLLTKIKAAATAYKADSANTDSLHSYLRALENLANTSGRANEGQ